MALEDLKATQSRIQRTLRDILWDRGQPTVTFHDRYTQGTVKEWLAGLEDLVRRFKWSSDIPITEVFTEVRYTWYKNRADVPFEALLALHGVYRGLGEEDRDLLAKTVQVRLNDRFEEKVEEPEDELPF